MRHVIGVILIAACLGNLFMVLERQTELRAERERAHIFSTVLAECANGKDFQIDGRRVKCRPAK